MWPKKSQERRLGIHTGCGTCFKSWIHLKFVDFTKTLPIYIFTRKNYFLRKFKKRVDFFQIYVCSTHCEVGYKVGQHDIWAWTPNNLKISSVTLGHKILKFPQKKLVSQSLSFHIIFSIKVYIGHNLVCIQNEQNTIFDFFPTKFGALLILQECPKYVQTYTYIYACVYFQDFWATRHRG